MESPINVRSFGAVGDGKADDTAAIIKAFTFAMGQRLTVIFPPLVYAYSDVLWANGLVIDGPGATLYALNPARAALFLTGVGSAVNGINFGGVASPRLSTRESCRVVAVDASGFTMQGVTVSVCAGAALRSDRSGGGLIESCTVVGSMADAIHITDKSHDIEIAHNIITRPGDDGIAVVSYQGNGGYVQRVRAHHNTISDQTHGRGMSVVGGRGVVYEFNQVRNNRSAAGIYLAQEDSYSTYGCHDVTVRRNSLYNCGGDGVTTGDHTAILAFSSKFEKNTDLRIERNAIVSDVKNTGGIRDFSDDVDVVIDSNVMMGCTPNYRISYPALIPVIPWTGGPVGVQE